MTLTISTDVMCGGCGEWTGTVTGSKVRGRRARGHCVAAAAVDVINSGRGGNKLPSWWKTDA